MVKTFHVVESTAGARAHTDLEARDAKSTLC